MGNPRYQKDGPDGPGFGLSLHYDKLTEPLSWRAPRKIFVNSMSDLFHRDVPESFIARVFETMAACPQHQFQILTKRPRRMARLIPQVTKPHGILPNVWLGTSIESDEYTWRADWVRRTPSAIRFLSLEPLLGPLPSLNLEGLDWVIVGGESGSGHRPLDPSWVRDLRNHAASASVAFFFKQWGGRTPKAGGRELDGRTWDEMPSLQVLAELASSGSA
jgi:protein gp37